MVLFIDEKFLFCKKKYHQLNPVAFEKRIIQIDNVKLYFKGKRSHELSKVKILD